MAMEILHQLWPILVTVLGLAAGFGANRMAVMQLATKIDALTVTVAALHSVLNGLTTKLAVHEVEVKHHIREDEHQFKALQKRVEQLDQHVERIRQTCLSTHSAAAVALRPIEEKLSCLYPGKLPPVVAATPSKTDEEERR